MGVQSTDRTELVSQTIANLRRDGARITAARRAIIELLFASKRPLTVAEILKAKTVRDVSREKTTVYREIEFLISKGIALGVDLKDGVRRFEAAIHGAHHHHLICTVCDGVTCVTLPKHLEQLENELGERHDFEIQSHTLEFFGRCSDCRRKRGANQSKKAVDS